MLVKQRMSYNPITIRPDTPVTEAQALMKREKIHYLPMLDKEERLVGIVDGERPLVCLPVSGNNTLGVGDDR